MAVASRRRVVVGQVICTQAGAYSFIATKAATAGHTNNRLRLCGIWVSEPVTIDRMGLEVTTAADAASVYRLGIYGDAGNWTPGALVADFGTVAADSTGVKELTVSQRLAAGAYFLASALQGSPTLAGGIRVGQEWVGSMNSTGAQSSVSNALGMFLLEGVTGAFPASVVGDVGSGGATFPRTFVRVA